MFSWLLESAFLSCIILAIGAIAVRLRRQPIERLRLIEWTLICCLVAPFLQLIPGLPHWSLGWSVAAQSPVSDPDHPQASVPRPSNNNEKSAPTAPAAKSIEQPNEESPPWVRPDIAKIGPPKDEVAPDTVARSEVVVKLANTAATAQEPMRSKNDSPLEGKTPRPAPFQWRTLIVIVYLIGVAVMVAWYLLGYLLLVWLDRTSRPAPESVVALFRSLTKSKLAGKVRLRTHRRMKLPLAYGLLHPTILLPEQMCSRLADHQVQLDRSATTSAIDAVRYSLLHEWSHISRGDLWRWRLSTIVGILFCYQPVFWYLRQQLRLCQDYLSDNDAAEHSSDREDYAQFLIGLVHYHFGFTSALTLSVGDRRSNLHRRVMMVLENRQPLAHELRRSRALAIAAGGFMLVALMSTVHLTAEQGRAQSQSAPPAGLSEQQAAGKNGNQESTVPAAESPATIVQPSPKEITYTGVVKAQDPGKVFEIIPQGGDSTARRELQIQEETSGKPVQGVRVDIKIFENPGPGEPRTAIPVKEFAATTDVNGEYSFTVPSELVDGKHFMQLAATHPNFILRRTPSMSRILTQRAPENLPSPLLRFANFAIDLLPGAVVTGVLQTPEGTPLVGAVVTALSRPEEWKTSRCTDEGKTDANGRFRVQMVEHGDGLLWVSPGDDYISERIDIKQKRGDLGTIKLQMQTGVTLRGRVVEADGKPCPNLQLQVNVLNPLRESSESLDSYIGTTRSVKTDKNGDFVVKTLPAGECRLFVQSDLALQTAHFLPKTVTLVGDKNPEPIEIRSNYTPDAMVQVTGHISISKEAIADLVNLSHLLRSTNNQVVINPTRPAELKDGESREETLRRFAPLIQGNINGANFRAKAEMEDNGNFTLRVPRGLQTASLLLASAGSIIQNLDPIAANSEGALEIPSPHWRLQPGTNWTKGNRIPFVAINHPAISDNLSGLEVEYPDIKKPAGFRVTSTVLDEDSGKPIQGATISVNLRQAVDTESQNIPLGDFLTDAEGNFTATIPFDIALKNLRRRGSDTPLIIELKVKHPQFASPRLQQDELRLNSNGIGAFPTLRTRGSSGFNPQGNSVPLVPLFMRPGERAAGVLLTPDGKGAAGVKVIASTQTPVGNRLRLASRQLQAQGNQHELSDKQWYGWQEVTTDADGRFRLLLPADGDSTLAILPSKDYALMNKAIGAQRGDLGVIQLEQGPSIKGRVVDGEGKPLAGLFLNAEPIGSDLKRPTVENPHSIDYLNRAAVTDTDGTFAFAPLAPGDYRVELRDSANDLTTTNLHEPAPATHPLPDVFMPHRVMLVAGRDPAPIDFHPATTVLIEGRVERSTTPLRDGYASLKPKITGQVNGQVYTADVTIDADGKFTAKVPRGINEVQIRFANHNGPQFRVGKDKPLTDPADINLGTVNDDVHDLEIVYP
jgi:beta-lactamase regulating signal transducer with metallopeptidase domain/uncharacterized GH25 family protein